MTPQPQRYKYAPDGTPHPCESCDFWEKEKAPREWICNKANIRLLAYSEVSLIRTVGCASHSSSRPAPSPCPQYRIWQYCPVRDEIAAQAREDVLDALAVDDFGDLFDKLVNWFRIIDEDSDHMPWRFIEISNTIYDYRKSLRTQKEAQR